jgi:collagen type VII alpha
VTVLVGQQSAGTTTDFSGNGSTAGFPFVAAADGVAATIFGQFKVANAGLTSVRLGIYDASFNLLGVATVASGFTGTGVFSADISGSAITIVNGTTYVLAYWGTGEQVDIQGTTGGTGTREDTAANFPAALGADGTMGVLPVLWVEDAGAIAPVFAPPVESPTQLNGPDAPPGWFEEQSLLFVQLVTAVDNRNGTSSVSAGGQATSTGLKGALGASSVRAGEQVVSTGTKGARGSSTTSAGTRVTSTGAKGASGASTVSAGARVTAAALKGALSASVVSAGLRVSSLAQKGAAALSRVSAGVRVTSTGTSATPPDNRNGTSRVSAGARATSTGQKGAASQSTVTAGTRATSTGRKGALVASVVSAGARAIATGRKGALAASIVSAGAAVLALGRKAAAAISRVSAGASATSVGSKGARGASTVSAGAAVGQRGPIILPPPELTEPLSMWVAATDTTVVTTTLDLTLHVADPGTVLDAR